MRADDESRADGSAMGTDARLLTRLCAGEREAFDVLFIRHYRAVYSVLYRLVGDDADDLAQEVFLILYRRPPARIFGAKRDTLGAWLYRVALNLGYNALRARRRRKKQQDALGADLAADVWQSTEPSPEVQVERSQVSARVRQALARLGRRDASLLVLRYSDLSYREIADVLGVAPASVGTLLARAERAFARVYQDAQEGEDALSE